MFFNFFQKKPSTANIRPVVLLILDGWGVAPPSQGNAISLADTVNLDLFAKNYPYAEIIASGESVGLPANEEGNSEVGHLTLGAGRVVNQSLKRINLAIENGSFFSNKAFLFVLNHLKKPASMQGGQNSKLHIIGLVGSGDVHSSLNHFNALVDFCEREKITNACFHLFTDGRDAPPREAKEIIAKIEITLKTKKVGRIASLSGRYYAMDRDRHWERTEKVYNALVLGKGVLSNSAGEAIDMAYKNDQTDEFIDPTIILDNGHPVGTIDNNDAAIFFNFRVDRSRQISMALTLKDFENLKEFEFEEEMLDKHEHNKKVKYSGRTFKREKYPENLYFVTMTQYQANIPVSAVAFPPQTALENLAEIISKAGLKQLHMAESEKERMVTYYFNGRQNIKYAGEDDKIVTSPKVATFDKKPEMSLFKLIDEFKKALAKDYYHFIVMNFANPDMVAHSGDIKATIKACEYVDKAVLEVANQTLNRNGTLLITADHGNAEELLTFPSTNYFFTTSEGSMNTEHSNNPVPVIIINKSFLGKGIVLPKGALCDIAPTILSLLNIPIPGIMKGRNLLETKHV